MGEGVLMWFAGGREREALSDIPLNSQISLSVH